MSTSNVLFVCHDNAVASILAEAYIARAGRGLWRAFSAGLEPAREFNPHVVDLLRARGLRTQRFAPRSLASFTVSGAPRIDLVVRIDPREEGFEQLPGLPPSDAWFGAPAVASACDVKGCFDWIRRKADRLLLGGFAVPVRRFA
ncbi:MAG: hypothetical protein U1E46_05685 [Hyphomicrobiales bacterium]